jgi:hypothetical protein
MFCPNCGEKLESTFQKFCSSCGSELFNTPDTPQAPQLRAEEKHVSPPVRPAPVYESKTIRVGGPGPHSKRCFAFAIVSLGLVGVAYFYGGSNLFRIFTPYYYYYYSFGMVGFITTIIVHIAGLVFGILSRTNSSKAGKFEPINTLEKVGSVFGVFGIVINSIFIVSILIVVIIRVISLVLMAPYYI